MGLKRSSSSSSSSSRTSDGIFLTELPGSRLSYAGTTSAARGLSGVADPAALVPSEAPGAAKLLELLSSDSTLISHLGKILGKYQDQEIQPAISARILTTKASLAGCGGGGAAAAGAAGGTSSQQSLLGEQLDTKLEMAVSEVRQAKHTDRAGPMCHRIDSNVGITAPPESSANKSWELMISNDSWRLSLSAWSKL